MPEPGQNVREFWQKRHETGLVFFHKNTKRVQEPVFDHGKNKQFEVENVHDKQNQNLITLRPEGSLELCSYDRKIILSLRTMFNPSPSGIPSRYVDKHRTRLRHLCLLDAKMEMRLVVNRRVHNGVCKHSHSHYFLCRNLHWWWLEALPLFSVQCPGFFLRHDCPLVFPLHCCSGTSSQRIPVVTSYLGNHQRRGRKRGRRSGRSSAPFCYKSSWFCRSQVWFTACQGKYLDCPQLDLISADAFCLLPESQHKAAVDGFQMQSTLSLLSY